jgi:hypothetical protein
LQGGIAFTLYRQMRNLINTNKMVKTRKVILLLTMVTSAMLMTVAGCKKDDTTTPPQETSYNLYVKDVLGVTGTVTFIETSKTSATIEIVLVNAPSGSHPAFLLTNSEVEEGSVVVSLNPVDANGKSSTLVSTMTYSQLNAYDGNIKVTKSSTEPGIILAQGDIGGNVITTTNKSYAIDTIGVYGVSGTALFEKRVNGNTLVTITLAGTISGEVYPASINLGSIASVGGGPVVKLLSNVDGTTGKSFSNIRKLDSGIDITYNNWLVYDGYINIYQSPLSVGNIICQGNIGSN